MLACVYTCLCVFMCVHICICGGTQYVWEQGNYNRKTMLLVSYDLYMSLY